ncbi:hypothetical protein [Virgibacillus doumboii]|uniref:hypothetical protein n=1 Tax=Virgibacillus doumboii TaxID=2697503 RepID=UPI0013DEC1A5|nr:hypothetical protein [Virgibacillus doumboii]
MNIKKTKAERKRDREILSLYHKYLTEKELEPLYEQFKQWKTGHLPYDELTELIHEFHKKNQEIWKTFNYDNDEYLVFRAKQELDMFNEKDLENELYQRLWSLYAD